MTAQSIVRSFIYHPGFKRVQECSSFSNWRQEQVERFYVVCPKGGMLIKQQILRSSIGTDFQYIQVKNFLGTIQKVEKLDRPIEEFETLLIKPEQKQLMSRLYKPLLAKVIVCDIAKDKWQKDLHKDLTDSDWCYISGCVCKIMGNIALGEHRFKLQHQYITPVKRVKNESTYS